MTRKGTGFLLALCALLLMILLCGTACADLQSDADRYDAALMQLNAYLKQSSSADLAGAIASFQELRGYGDSNGFRLYAEVIRQVDVGNGLTDTVQNYLTMLQKNTDLQQRLADEEFQTLYPYIRSVEELVSYVQARQWESQWRNSWNGTAKEKALELYGSCMNFYDATDRSMAMISDKTTASVPTSTPKPTPRALSDTGNYRVGSTVSFGYYEQDNNTKNGKEPIQWLVLAVKDHQALLLSKYGLDCQSYNTSDEAVTWETCTLRAWLNDTFYKAAFTKAERAAIVKKTVSNKQSQGYSGFDTSGGNNTKDRVFLLSYAEANKYLSVTMENTNNLQSRVAPTAYALAQGAWSSSDYETTEGKAVGGWWLRSPGDNQSYAMNVSRDGSFRTHSVDHSSACIRPALWVNLESSLFPHPLTPTPKPTTNGCTIYVTKAGAYIRSRPSTDSSKSKVLGYDMPVGTELTATKEVPPEDSTSTANWYKITWEGKTAYISTRSASQKGSATTKPDTKKPSGKVTTPPPTKANITTPPPTKADITTPPPSGGDTTTKTQVTQYRYRDTYQAYSAWSSWSAWSTTRQSVDNADLKREESRYAYGWWAAKCLYCGQNNPNWKTACKSCKKQLTTSGKDFKSVFTFTEDKGSTSSVLGRAGGRYINGEPYWRLNTENDRTQYRYQTRTLETRQTSWSDWSTVYPDDASGRTIESRQVYQ